ncbi:MAG: CCA tRNA nucleotidyltransferase [Patescibacteria group bacterium]
MIDFIPKKVLEIYTTLQSNGHEVYLVGGCIRNILMKKDVTDWDLTTKATPEEILLLFSNGFYDNSFGTVGIPIEINDQPSVVEITTFRTEHGYTNKRHPDVIRWGQTIEEDLQRRDFTCNAIAMSLNLSQNSFDFIDPYKGTDDIKNGTLRAVGNPDERFREDALRLLRAVRFASVLDFTIEETTLEELKKNASLIKEISGERIKTELFKILQSDKSYEGVLLLQESGLLKEILPELLEGIGISQTRPGRHHTTDVFTHNVMSMKLCPSTDPLVRFATLLHDAGKPKVESKDENGLVIFYNHEVVGARIARNICDRLKFSKKERDKVFTLIRWHMFTVDEKITDAAVRRFIRRIGIDNVQDMMDLRIGDRLGGGTQTAQSWRLKLFRKRIDEQLQPAPFSVNDLAIDGNDIMQTLKIKPSKQVGTLLQELFEEVDEDLSKNTKEYLLKRVKQLS